MAAQPGPKLPPAGVAYTQRNEQEFRNELERRDDLNHKKDRHLEMRPGTYLIISSPDGTRYSVTVANGGTLTVTSL